jgi:hypothetical protein
MRSASPWSLNASTNHVKNLFRFHLAVSVAPFIRFGSLFGFHSPHLPLTEKPKSMSVGALAVKTLERVSRTLSSARRFACEQFLIRRNKIQMEFIFKVKSEGGGRGRGKSIENYFRLMLRVKLQAQNDHKNMIHQSIRQFCELV